MKRAVLVSCACLLAAPVAAQTGTADKKLLKETARTMVEDRTRQDFEEAQNKVSQRDKDAMDAINAKRTRGWPKRRQTSRPTLSSPGTTCTCMISTPCGLA